MMVAMAAHWHQPGEIIYHVGSSVRNPMRVGKMPDVGLCYFTKKPLINKEGKPVKVGKVTVLSSMPSFRRYMAIRYLLLLKVGDFLIIHLFDVWFLRKLIVDP